MLQHCLPAVSALQALQAGGQAQAGFPIPSARNGRIGNDNHTEIRNKYERIFLYLLPSLPLCASISFISATP